MSIDNLQLLVKKRSHSPHPQKAIPTERFAIALPHPKSDSYGALRYRIPTSPKAIPTERFAIASPHLPKQRFLRSASLSHFHTPKAIPTERFAIASPHPQQAIAPSPTAQNYSSFILRAC
jgi:hypothetical protein